MPRLGVPLAIALFAVSAHAAPSEALRLDYVAASGCPSADAFLDQVRARSPRIRSASGNEPARTLVVRLASRNHRTTGRLTLREVDGSEAERSVVGESCSDVAAGLALIAALAVDPTASSETPASSGTPASSRTPGAPGISGIPGTPGTPSDAGADAAPVSESLATAPPATPPADLPQPPLTAVKVGASRSNDTALPAEVDRRHWQLAFGAHGEVASGALPNVLVAVPVFVEVARVSGTLLAPAARVRFERAASGVVASAAGSAEFTWTAGSLDLCPIAWSRAALRLTPCLRTEVGAVEAAGINVQPARSGVRPWWSMGTVARGRWVVYGPLFVELEAAFLVAIVRDRFFLEQGGTVFRPSLVGGSASAGIGVSIW